MYNFFYTIYPLNTCYILDFSCDSIKIIGIVICILIPLVVLILEHFFKGQRPCNHFFTPITFVDVHRNITVTSRCLRCGYIGGRKFYPGR